MPVPLPLVAIACGTARLALRRNSAYLRRGSRYSGGGRPVRSRHPACEIKTRHRSHERADQDQYLLGKVGARYIPALTKIHGEWPIARLRSNCYDLILEAVEETVPLRDTQAGGCAYPGGGQGAVEIYGYDGEEDDQGKGDDRSDRAFRKSQRLALVVEIEQRERYRHQRQGAEQHDDPTDRQDRQPYIGRHASEQVFETKKDHD